MHSVLEIIAESTGSAGPDLISLADLKVALGIAAEDTSEDAALAAAITFQSRIIAEYCDRRFGFAEAVETFTFDPGETLLRRQALVLSLYPVADVTEVSTAGATTGDWHFEPVSGRLWSEAGYWADTVMVSYAGGYDLPEEAPARLQQAVITAVNEGRTIGTRDPSIQELQHGDTRVRYFTSATSSASPGHLSAPVIDLIRPYRRLTVA